MSCLIEKFQLYDYSAVYNNHLSVCLDLGCYNFANNAIIFSDPFDKQRIISKSTYVRNFNHTIKQEPGYLDSSSEEYIVNG